MTFNLFASVPPQETISVKRVVKYSSRERCYCFILSSYPHVYYSLILFAPFFFPTPNYYQSKRVSGFRRFDWEAFESIDDLPSIGPFNWDRSLERCRKLEPPNLNGRTSNGRTTKSINTSYVLARPGKFTIFLNSLS